MVIGSTGAKQHAKTFHACFDPITAGGDHGFGEWAPVNAGVAAEGGVQQIQHSAAELLAAHPDYVVLKIDCEAAFQNASRSVFLNTIKQECPGMYAWAKACYARSSPRYVRAEDGTVRVFWCSAGTTQGDPFGPVDHNFSTVDLML